MRWQFMVSEAVFYGIAYGGGNGNLHSTSDAGIYGNKAEEYLVL